MSESNGEGSKFLTGEQRALVTAMLDAVVPPGEGLPGAGEVGVGDYLDRMAGESAELRRLFSAGLASTSMASEARFGRGFRELSLEERAEVLRGVEEEQPTFFRRLVLHAYNGYYTTPRILEALGLEARGPQPGGYALEAGDLSGLEEVRRRGEIYRKV